MLAGAACGRGASAPTATLAWTPWPTATSAATTPTPQSAAATTRSSLCSDAARFVEDLTIPDGSIVAPGAELDKRWAIQNSGTCDWGLGYRLIRVGGDEFGGPDALDLYPARAGERAILRVVLEAPLDPGDYISRWQAQSPEGVQFGDEVYVLVVVEAPTPTPTPTPLVTPEPTSE